MKSLNDCCLALRLPLHLPLRLPLLAVLCLTALLFGAKAQLIELNRVEAMVNGEPITKSEIDFAIAPQIQQLQRTATSQADFDASVKELRQETLDNLIANKLILQEFKKLGAVIPEREIDAEIERIIREQHDGDRGAFTESLNQGQLTQAGFRRILQERLIIREMRRAALGIAPPPSPAEIQQAYKTYEDRFRGEDFILYRNIFIPKQMMSDPMATPELQRELAKSIRKQVQNGASFEEMARNHSVLANAQEGGINPTRGRSELVEWSREPIFSTGVGQISELVERPEGFMLYFVENIQKGDMPPLEEIRDELENLVRADNQREDFDAWIAELKQGAEVTINP